MLDIKKQPGSVLRHPVSREDMALINAMARSALAPEEVYTFAVRLCDNEIDRDFERFDRAALKALGELFVGKSGIVDHQWSAQGQTARLYKTELVAEEGVTEAGEPCCYLKGYAYMLRSEKNEDLIAEIEAGIKKEVSIGCSVSRSVCSICGQSGCGHQRGRRYDGKLCYFTLQAPTDAYEWSFVAVPAQRKAGIIKGLTAGSGLSLRKLLAGHPTALAELEALEREAALGRSYMTGLRREAVRLAGMADEALDLRTFAAAMDKLDEAELKELTAAYQRRVDDKYPPLPQVRPRRAVPSADEADLAYLI